MVSAANLANNHRKKYMQSPKYLVFGGKITTFAPENPYKPHFNRHFLMATKIRLQRHGRKNYAFYPIVIADSRAPRDGRFIERIGSYNPNTNPATVTLNFERALYWVNVGAQPTDSVRNILSQEGVLLMKHLQGGVKKGAFDEAEAQRRFDAWKAEKQAAVDAQRTSMADKRELAAKERLAEEQAKNKAKAEIVAKKKAEIAAAKAEAEAAAAAAEAPAAEEEAAAETAEAPAAE